MDISDDGKATVLLNLLNYRLDNIQKREQRERQWFEWTTGMLLASFAAIIALSNGSSNALSHPILVKSLATVLVVVPVCVMISRILNRKGSTEDAKIVTRIEKLLHIFDEDYYGSHSPYPIEWAPDGLFSQMLRKRKTPFLYTVVLSIMTLSVVVTIWVIL